MKSKYLLFIICSLCALFLVACSQKASDNDISENDTKQSEDSSDVAEFKEESDTTESSAVEDTSDIKEEKEMQLKDETPTLTGYNWQGTLDGSLLVFQQDGTFRYYRSADDLTDSYYEGTYVFHVGKDAVTYITTTLIQYGVTEEKLAGVFDKNDEYDESNFVCFSLNNEACIIDGKNSIESPYETPYMGFYLEDEGSLYLDIANMNSGNYHLFIAK